MLLVLQLLLFLTLSVRTGGYYLSMVDECTTSSPDLTDAEYLRSYYFNNAPWVQFNSTLGTFVGFGEFGMQVAAHWSKSSYLKMLKDGLDVYCKTNLALFYANILDKTVEPVVKLRSEQDASGGHPAMLMCSAYDFYPPVIDVYWLRNGKKVTTETISTEEMADGDWYYQIHSHLEYTPTSGEKISCVVEHASFKEPVIYDWDGSLPGSERNKVAIGASGLVLGIILSAAGFIYYMKKRSGVL